jgi:RNA polymerase sigma-70 factor, ECF subfamily
MSTSVLESPLSYSGKRLHFASMNNKVTPPEQPEPAKKVDADFELVTRAQNGDRVAFNALVVRHQRRLANAISRFIRIPQEVEDVTQEAFIKAYRGLKSFRGDSTFSTWLHRIGINSAKNYLVAQKRKLPAHRLKGDEDDTDWQETSLAGANIEDPERLMLTRQIGEAVSAAMNTLPENERTALVLRELDGESYESIAAIMNCPVGTVRSRIFRAREHVALALKPLLEPKRDRRW